MTVKSETCPGCGGAPHHVSLPKRWGVCKTCDGKIHRYPLTSPDSGLDVGMWAHVDRADWIDNPHGAEPDEQAS